MERCCAVRERLCGADSSPTNADRKCSCNAVLPHTSSALPRRYSGRLCRACKSKVYLGRRPHDGPGDCVLNLTLYLLPCAPMDMQHTAVLTLVCPAEAGIYYSCLELLVAGRDSDSSGEDDWGTRPLRWPLSSLSAGSECELLSWSNAKLA